MPYEIVSTPPSVGATKLIIQGSYYGNTSPDTGTNIGGANCSAIVTKQRHRMPRGRTAVLKGFVIPNTGGTTSVASPVVGEGAATSSKTFKGSCFIQKAETVAYPLYAAQDASDRTLVLAANEFANLYTKGSIRLDAGDEVWTNLSVASSAASDNFSRNYLIDTTAGEGVEFYTNATASTNTTDSQTAADSFLQPTNAGNHVSEFTAQVATMGTAGMIVEVPATARHFAIIGTSRQRGTVNPFYNPTIKSDGAVQMALEDLGHTYVDLSRGGEALHLGFTDANSVFRRSLMIGVTDIIFGHTINMISANMSIADWQNIVKRECAAARANGQKFWLLTEPPYVDFGGGAGVVGDPTTGSSFASVSSTTTTKLDALYAWMTGSMSGTCSGGDPAITLADCCDAVINITDCVTQSAIKNQWLTPTEITSTYFSSPTVTSGTASALVVAGATSALKLYQSYDWLVKGQTSGAWGYIKGNTSTSAFSALTSATGANSWQGGDAFIDGEALKFYLCVSEDGLHPSFYGRQLQAAVIRAAIGSYTAPAFDPIFDIPKCVDVWTPKTGYNFTEITKTTTATAQSDAVRNVVGIKRRLNGVQGTAGNKPTINIVSGNKRWAYDSDAYFDFSADGALFLTNQNAWCLTTVIKWPASWASVGIFFRASLAAGNWVQCYTETTTNTLAISTRRVTGDAAAIADTGTFSASAGDVVALSFIVDWMNGRHEVWATGSSGVATLAVFDTVAWSGGSGKSGNTPTAMNFGHSATSANTDILAYAAHQCAPGPNDIQALHTYMLALAAAVG